MLKIGFTNKFYTLWSIDTRIEYNQQGCPSRKEYYWYHQNLSIDLRKAQEKALSMGVKSHNLEPDMELKGTKSWEREVKLYSELTSKTAWYFKFGKYVDTPILNCEDISYLDWYYSQTGNIHAKTVLLSNGYKIWVYDGVEELVSQEVYDLYSKVASDIENSKNLLSDIKDGKLTSLKVTLLSNLNGEGYSYENNNSVNIPLFFKEYKYMEYNGFGYSLPTIKGVGKKIKGKEIEVEFEGVDFNMNTQTNCAVVKSFKIL